MTLYWDGDIKRLRELAREPGLPIDTDAGLIGRAVDELIAMREELIAARKYVRCQDDCDKELSRDFNGDCSCGYFQQRDRHAW